jgi:Type II secretion system (T2SS), protein E, N-terminal domain
MPLGLLMLWRGSIGEDHLRKALSVQRRERHDKIGQWLQRLGYVTERQVVGALALQWATPVLTFRAASIAQTEIPSSLLNGLRLVPVRLVASQRLLYLASSDPVDYTVLQAIEEMTDWRTLACVVSDRVMDELLRQTTSIGKGDTPFFLKTTGPAEVSRIVASYAERLGAERVKLTSCGPYIWARLNGNHNRSDLLFYRSLQSRRETLLSGSADGEREESQTSVAG